MKRLFKNLHFGEYTGDYVGDYTRNFEGNYSRNFARIFVGNYTGNYTRTSLGNYSRNFNRTFVGNYQGNFTSDEIQSGTETIETYTLCQNGINRDNRSTPLKLQEQTVTSKRCPLRKRIILRIEAGIHLSNSTTSSVWSLNDGTLGGSHQTVGTYSDTVYDQAVGTL